jgi:predicted RNA-binding protein associated with RNAse of E/G family
VDIQINEMEKVIHTLTNGAPFVFYIPGTHLRHINVIASMENCIAYRLVEDGLDAYTPFGQLKELFDSHRASHTLSKNTTDRLFYLSTKCINTSHPKFDRAFGLFEGSFAATSKTTLLGNIFAKTEMPEYAGADAILVICNHASNFGRPHFYYIESLRWLFENEFIPKGYKTILFKFRRDDLSAILEDACTTLFDIYPQLKFVEIDSNICLEDVIRSTEVAVYSNLSSSGLYAAKMGRQSYALCNVFLQLDPGMYEAFVSKNKNWLHFPQTLARAGVRMLKADPAELAPYKMNAEHQKMDILQFHVLNSHRILSEKLDNIDRQLQQSTALEGQIAALYTRVADIQNEHSFHNGILNEQNRMLTEQFHQQQMQYSLQNERYARIEQLLQKPLSMKQRLKNRLKPFFPYGSVRWKIAKAVQERRLFRTAFSFAYRKTKQIIKAILRPFFPPNSHRRKALNAVRERRIIKTTLKFLLHKLDPPLAPTSPVIEQESPQPVIFPIRPENSNENNNRRVV